MAQKDNAPAAAPTAGPAAAWRKPKRKQPDQPAARAQAAFGQSQQPAAAPSANNNGQQEQQRRRQQLTQQGGGGGEAKHDDLDDEDLLHIDQRSLKQAQEALIHMSERNKRLRGEREAANKEAADLRVKLNATNDLWMNAVNAERQGHVQGRYVV